MQLGTPAEWYDSEVFVSYAAINLLYKDLQNGDQEHLPDPEKAR
jgi:hypothetical protein